MTPETPQSPPSEHVIVCGLGHVGYRVVQLLIRLGQRGVVIARESNPDWRRAIEREFRVLAGDARDDRLLAEAGVAAAKAVLIVTGDDLANLSIALDARRMNPRAAIIVRQFDQDLAVHLEQSVQIDRALSTSALAAPRFVAAVLGTAAQGSFAVGEETCRLGEHLVENEAARSQTLGQWSANTGRAAVAVCRQGQAIPAGDPGAAILPGDRVVALCMDGRHGRGQAAAPPCPRRGPGVSRPRRFWMGCRQWWREVPRALRVAMIALAAVVLMSVFVFRAAMGIPLIDALYFAITTITTVGYGDYSLKDAPPGLKLYGAFVMLCGAAMLAMIVGIATDLILRTRLRDLMAHGAAHYRDHVIVAGLGNVGFRLVRELAQAGQSVVGIEHRPDAPLIEAARQLVPVVLGNAKTIETLHKAGAAGARAVVAVTDDDLANLSTVLAARRIGPSCRTVLRLFDPELAEKMQRGLAADAVLSVSAAAAPTFVAAALCPGALFGFLLGDRLLAVFHRVVSDDASAAGTAGENQCILLVKRAGAARYEPLAAGAVPGRGDEVLGVRWHPLCEIRGAP